MHELLKNYKDCHFAVLTLMCNSWVDTKEYLIECLNIQTFSLAGSKHKVAYFNQTVLRLW